MYGGVDEVAHNDVEIIIFREKFRLEVDIQEVIMCKIPYLFQDKET
jgi:hypothetical protein